MTWIMDLTEAKKKGGCDLGFIVLYVMSF
jgi:hypothetical protein